MRGGPRNGRSPPCHNGRPSRLRSGSGRGSRKVGRGPALPAGGAAASAGTRAGGVFGLLGRVQVPLFGGALGGPLPKGLAVATGLHPLTDPVAEATQRACHLRAVGADDQVRGEELCHRCQA